MGGSNFFLTGMDFIQVFCLWQWSKAPLEIHLEVVVPHTHAICCFYTVLFTSLNMTPTLFFFKQAMIWHVQTYLWKAITSVCNSDRNMHFYYFLVIISAPTKLWGRLKHILMLLKAKAYLEDWFGFIVCSRKPQLLFEFCMNETSSVLHSFPWAPPGSSQWV